MRPLALLLALLAAPAAALPPDSLAAAAEGACVAASVPTARPTTHEWLYGVGHLNVLDTYLTPLEYTGTSFSVTHRSERLARWGHARVLVQGYFSGYGAYLHSPTDDHREWDARLTAAVAWLRQWTPGRRWRLAAGGMAEGLTGFTYNTIGGNNPAQGRLAADLGATLLAEYRFRLLHRTLAVRTQADAPLVGVMFSPHYGQSYYEIFSLGQHSSHVRFTYPVNAPSVRWTTTCRFPLWGATLAVGYAADIRQSDVNALKHHAWNHQLVVGYVRRLQLLR
jgi:hypothetical protein